MNIIEWYPPIPVLVLKCCHCWYIDCIGYLYDD